MKSKLFAVALVGTMALQAQAGFNPNFSAWTALGDAGLLDDAAFLTNAFSDGTDDPSSFNISGGDPVTVDEIETFSGAALGGFLLAGFDISEGSVIRQTFSVLTGETISFDWIFLTNDDEGDFAFVVLDGTISLLADTANVFPGAPYGYASSVAGTFVSAPFASDSTVTLAIGVADVSDFSVSSAIRVPTIIPEPSTAMLIAGALGLLGLRRRRS
jgi:hypothetical protein